MDTEAETRAMTKFIATCEAMAEALEQLVQSARDRPRDGAWRLPWSDAKRADVVHELRFIAGVIERTPDA